MNGLANLELTFTLQQYLVQVNVELLDRSFDLHRLYTNGLFKVNTICRAERVDAQQLESFN